jgi:carbon-monoxide dehydrogenase iron sulfur subunit
MVCPYDAIFRDEEREVAIKCDLCPDREIPACVEACPTEALVFTA